MNCLKRACTECCAITCAITLQRKADLQDDINGVRSAVYEPTHSIGSTIRRSNASIQRWERMTGTGMEITHRMHT